jgi:hypothetical protein
MVPRENWSQTYGTLLFEARLYHVQSRNIKLTAVKLGTDFDAYTLKITAHRLRSYCAVLFMRNVIYIATTKIM